MSRYCDVFETPLGWMGVVATAAGLRRTTLPQPSPNRCVSLLGVEAAGATMRPDLLERLRERALRYFSGERVDLSDEPIDVEDAPQFLKAAWAACRSIRYGETRSYGWLAEQAGRPRAPRAAGQSMARNRLPLVVPCHRVVASDGGLGGFGGGASQLDLKRALLDLEARAWQADEEWGVQRGAEPLCRPPQADEGVPQRAFLPASWPGSGSPCLG